MRRNGVEMGGPRGRRIWLLGEEIKAHFLKLKLRERTEPVKALASIEGDRGSKNPQRMENGASACAATVEHFLFHRLSFICSTSRLLLSSSSYRYTTVCL